MQDVRTCMSSHRPIFRKRRRLVIASLTGVVAFAGCGGGASSRSSPLTTLRVGFVPVVEGAPLFIANQLGYFRQEHVEVQLDPLQNASSIAPSILNGQLQVGNIATVPYVLAVSKGLPLKAISSVGKPSPGDSGIVVSPSSGIARPRDLAGKTVAVNQLDAVLQLVTSADIQKDGGDPSTTKFLALPLPAAITAVQSGRVDAATVVEPFVTIARQDRLNIISHPYSDVLTPGTGIDVSITSTAYLASHRRAISGFVRALDRATRYAASHPQAVREAVVQLLNLAPPLAQAIDLPTFDPSLTTASIEPTLRLMVKYGFLTKAPPPSALIASP